MSGSLSTYTGGGSRYLTNPKHLNALSVAKANIKLKTSSTGVSDLSAGAGFTALALRGLQTSITIADTYVTVGSLTGPGFAFNFVSPTHDGGTHTPTMRITVDGTVYTIAPSAAQAIGNRMVLGPTTLGIPSTSTAATIGSDLSGINSASDIGFVGSSAGGLVVLSGAGQVVSFPTPEEALSYMMQCLRFESSLLVEMKCSALSGTAVDKQCGFTFRMDL